jgi:hypothetical protein
MHLFVSLLLLVLFSINPEISFADEDSGSPPLNNLEPIKNVFVEPFGCPSNSLREDCGIRYKVRNVDIAGDGNIKYLETGGTYDVTMEILHDCMSCGNAINQIIVGLSSDEKAQISVWSGKQRSGGGMRVVNYGTSVESPAQENFEGAEWIKVYFKIEVPDEKGVYYLRTRYSQAYTGNVLTYKNALEQQQVATEPLKWWKVDRPNGPSSDSNIGAFVIK